MRHAVVVAVVLAAALALGDAKKVKLPHRRK
jgi:hypothetical protein